jgi:hypothetical protein
MRTTILTLCLAAAAAAQTAPQPPAPCPGLPPGKHSLLERFTEQFGLSCAQQLKIEPILHDEESVSKPLLAFPAFTPEEQRAVMTRIKLAARRRVRLELTPDQQKEMDQEIESVSQSARKGGKKDAKLPAAAVDLFDAEEALAYAVINYRPLDPQEKTVILLEVKRAARRSHPGALTAEHIQKLDSDIDQLSRK